MRLRTFIALLLFGCLLYPLVASRPGDFGAGLVGGLICAVVALSVVLIQTTWKRVVRRGAGRQTDGEVNAVAGRKAE